MGRCRSGHNGAVLKTGGLFGSRFSIFPVFSTGRGSKKLRENRNFSPSFSPFSEKRWSGNTFGDVPKWLKGPVLKTGEYFRSRFSISPVFSTGRGCKKLRENRDFSPSFSPFFRETLEREYIWRCTQAVEGNGLENREVGVENRRGGSNPSISASQSKVRFALIFYSPHQEIAFKASCKPLVIAAAESRLELHSRCA